jgi:thiamine biosynthesis protein ThiS
MKLFLNGEIVERSDGLTVAALLDSLELAAKGVAIELNREIVSRSAFETTMLSDGDRLEIVHFVGGG